MCKLKREKCSVKRKLDQVKLSFHTPNKEKMFETNHLVSFFASHPPSICSSLSGGCEGRRRGQDKVGPGKQFR